MGWADRGWVGGTVTGPRFRLLDHPKLDVIQILSVENPLHLEKEGAEPSERKGKAILRGQGWALLRKLPCDVPCQDYCVCSGTPTNVKEVMFLVRLALPPSPSLSSFACFTLFERFNWSLGWRGSVAVQAGQPRIHWGCPENFLFRYKNIAYELCVCVCHGQRDQTAR